MAQDKEMPITLEEKVRARFKERGFDVPPTLLRDIMVDIATDLDQRLRRLEEPAQRSFQA